MDNLETPQFPPEAAEQLRSELGALCLALNEGIKRDIADLAGKYRRARYSVSHVALVARASFDCTAGHNTWESVEASAYSCCTATADVLHCCC